MSDLTAIDILINPDEKTLNPLVLLMHVYDKVCQAVLNLMLLIYLISLYCRRYVRTADLEKVFEAIQKTIAETDMTSLTFRAVAIKHAD